MLTHLDTELHLRFNHATSELGGCHHIEDFEVSQHHENSLSDHFVTGKTVKLSLGKDIDS
jgi:hypothetical protein